MDRKEQHSSLNFLAGTAIKKLRTQIIFAEAVIDPVSLAAVAGSIGGRLA